MKNVADVYHLTPVQRETLGNAHAAQARWKIHGELDSGAFQRAWLQFWHDMRCCGRAFSRKN